MKAITLRLPESEMDKLRKIKNAGFSSVNEVIKCAALSLVDGINKAHKNRKSDRR